MSLCGSWEGRTACLSGWCQASHMQGSGLGEFLASGSRVIQHQLSLFQDREKVLTAEVIGPSEEQHFRANSCRSSRWEANLGQSGGQKMGIRPFIQHLLVEYLLYVRTGAINWQCNSKKPNQQKSRYGSALVELLVYWGRQILINYSLTPGRGSRAIRGIWTSQENHKGLLGSKWNQGPCCI